MYTIVYADNTLLLPIVIVVLTSARLAVIAPTCCLRVPFSVRRLVIVATCLPHCTSLWGITWLRYNSEMHCVSHTGSVALFLHIHRKWPSRSIHHIYTYTASDHESRRFVYSKLLNELQHAVYLSMYIIYWYTCSRLCLRVPSLTRRPSRCRVNWSLKSKKAKQ